MVLVVGVRELVRESRLVSRYKDIAPKWSYNGSKLVPSESGVPNLSIKNVPESGVARFRERAARNHRSLQGELMDLICRVAGDESEDLRHDGQDRQTSGWMSVDQLWDLQQRNGGNPASDAPLAVDIIRKERDAR